MKKKFLRREMKQRAKQNVKKHYLIIVMICLFASFFGIEYGKSMIGFHATTNSLSDSLTSLVTIMSEGEATGDDGGLTKMVQKISQGKSGEVRKEIEAKQKDIRDNESGDFLGRRKGVLSGIVNSYSSGEFRFMVVQALISMSGSQTFSVVLLILGSLIVYLFIWLFIKETYRVIMRRIILEARTYERVTVQRFIYPLRSRTWPQLAWNMFVRSFYMFFWSLTIVGAVIKHYSYSMLPYIMAENPKIKANQAITLSRQMMKGHKWELFVADCSFLGWSILDLLTVGLVGIFYSNPYKLAFYAEFYTRRREEAIEAGLDNADFLCDEYLYRKPEASLLADTYPEVVRSLDEGKQHPVVEPTGFTGFLVKWFGVELFPNAAIDEYETNRSIQYQLRVGQALLAGEVYPGRLAPVPMSYKSNTGSMLRPTRTYSLESLIYIFFTMSIVGWLWEVSIHLVRDGEFVNRGIMQGPWLPIYGAGSILVLVVLKRFREKPILELLATMFVCGCVEYFTSWYMEMRYDGQKWWDYTGYFLNLNGRICGEGLLVFGLGGLAIVYFLAPVIDNALRVLRKMNPKALMLVALLLVGSFAVDQVYSKKHPNTGEGISTGGSTQVAMQMVETRAFDSSGQIGNAPNITA